jgi:hypothetical protein
MMKKNMNFRFLFWAKIFFFIDVFYISHFLCSLTFFVVDNHENSTEMWRNTTISKELLMLKNSVILILKSS